MAELSGELKAMAQIEAALKDLIDDERFRVMQWATARFRVSAKQGGKPPSLVEGGSAEVAGYGTLAEFYDAAAPATETDRALVGTYWFQFHEGVTDVEAQRVNTELKQLGHGVSNITRAFDALKSQKPALIMQTRKEGTSKQARKKYKVTTEGKKAVERMLSPEPE